jgi:hypothetical protein
MSFVVISVCFLPLFSLGVGQSVQEAMLIWPSVVCGNTACHLAHQVVCVSLAGKSWHLAAREPSWFLCLMWKRDALGGLGGVEESEFCLFLVVFLISCISGMSLCNV